VALDDVEREQELQEHEKQRRPGAAPSPPRPEAAKPGPSCIEEQGDVRQPLRPRWLPSSAIAQQASRRAVRQFLTSLAVCRVPSDRSRSARS